MEVLGTSIKANSIETQLMLKESYDIHYGIHNHELDSSNPYALVSLHEKENLNRVNPLYEMFDSFIENSVLKYTGLSLDKFLEFPRDQVFKILDKCRRLKEQEASMQHDILQGLNAVNKK